MLRDRRCRRRVQRKASRALPVTHLVKPVVRTRQSLSKRRLYLKAAPAGSRRRVFLAVYSATALGCRYWFKNFQLGLVFRGVKANEHFPASCRAGFGGSSQFANPSTSN